MAKIVLLDMHVIVNAVVLSSNANKVTIEMNSELIKATAFSQLTINNLLGVKDWSIDIDFMQDFAATLLDSQLFALWNNQTTFPIELRATSAARSASNPAYVSAAACLPSYSPVSNGHGELAMTTVKFVPGNGVTTMTRLTA